MLPTPQTYSSFLIRFWWEPAATGPEGMWRATIEHIQSGEQTAITTVAAIAQFLIDYAGPNPILLPAAQTLK